MIFEVAVFIASRLQERLGIPLPDDEIAYIAMHVGGRLERSRRADQLLTATIVCPGYYDLHELLRSSVDRSLGQAIEVVGVETRVDPDWALDRHRPGAHDDRPRGARRSDREDPAVPHRCRRRARAGRGRRGSAATRRLARLRTELERYFEPLGLRAGAGCRRRRGGRHPAPRVRCWSREGVIDEDYVERTIERERMSSTAFTDALAVPHALGMTATRTAIAIGIADPSIPWGDGRVQVVALVAFSETDREAFQTVFEQFVEVFSERESVQRIVRRSTDFTGFLDELVAVIDG